MAGFGGVDEEGGRAGGGKGRGDLAADMARLAEPGDDQPPLGIPDQVGGGDKGCAQIGLQRCRDGGDPAALGVERAQGRLDGGISGIGCRMILPSAVSD